MSKQFTLTAIRTATLDTHFSESSYSVSGAFLAGLASGRGDAGHHDLTPAQS